MDHQFQRWTFTDQKMRNLVKPTLIVSSTGYIVELIEPYLARNNDAMILNHFMKSSQGELLKTLLGPNGVLLADRGYRDSVAVLQEQGFKCHIPAFVKHGKALNVEESNSARQLTKVRSVVERSIGRLKQFRLFKGTVTIKALRTIGQDLRIASALINRFYRPLVIVPLTRCGLSK